MQSFSENIFLMVNKLYSLFKINQYDANAQVREFTGTASCSQLLKQGSIQKIKIVFSGRFQNVLYFNRILLH